jgi:hypothetical protein
LNCEKVDDLESCQAEIVVEMIVKILALSIAMHPKAKSVIGTLLRVRNCGPCSLVWLQGPLSQQNIDSVPNKITPLGWLGQPSKDYSLSTTSAPLVTGMLN